MAAPIPYADGRITVKQSGTVPVTTHVPAYAWQCDECGWLGTGWTSESGALTEAQDHLWNDHGMVPCDPEKLGNGHRWKRVQGTDSIDQCERCGRYCGK